MRLNIEDIPQFAGLLSMEMTLWGVPGAYNNPETGPDHVLSEAERDFGPPGHGGDAAPASHQWWRLRISSARERAVSRFVDPTGSVLDEASSTSPPWSGL